MVDLPLLPDPLPTTHKTRDTRLLAPSTVFKAAGEEFGFCAEVVVNGGDGGVLRDVEIVVERQPEGGHPGEGPPHAFLVRGDLLDGRSGDDDEGGRARVQMFEGDEVVGGHAAGRAAGRGGGPEHEVFDD